MSNNTQMAERRKHPRYATQGCIFVAGLKIGRLIDISRGGMAFYYADRKPWPQTILPRGSVRCTHEFMIPDLPTKIISDKEMPHNFKKGAMTVRRRSVSFGELTATQLALLDRLIAIAAQA
ncbi:MAG: PilZ domain-containing protein [Desulfobulbaceae bacterium]|nr:PilZ domain-containing protein [Desulfobulbaceae bacterium]